VRWIAAPSRQASLLALQHGPRLFPDMADVGTRRSFCSRLGKWGTPQGAYEVVAVVARGYASATARPSTCMVLVEQSQQFGPVDQMNSGSTAKFLALRREPAARDEHPSAELLGEQTVERTRGLNAHGALRVVLAQDYQVLAVGFCQLSRADINAPVLAESRHFGQIPHPAVKPGDQVLKFLGRNLPQIDIPWGAAYCRLFDAALWRAQSEKPEEFVLCQPELQILIR